MSLNNNKTIEASDIEFESFSTERQLIGLLSLSRRCTWRAGKGCRCF